MTFDVENLAELPNMTDHMCFACGPVNEAGLRMKFYTDEEAVYSRLTIANHLCGWDKLVHGGIISAVLDEIMSWSAIHLLKRFVMTKTITVEFIKPIQVGRPLLAEGRVAAQETAKEAQMEGLIRNAAGQVCARSTGNFVLLKPKVAQRLGIMNQTTLDFFKTTLGI